MRADLIGHGGEVFGAGLERRLSPSMARLSSRTFSENAAMLMTATRPPGTTRLARRRVAAGVVAGLRGRLRERGAGERERRGRDETGAEDERSKSKMVHGRHLLSGRRDGRSQARPCARQPGSPCCTRR